MTQRILTPLFCGLLAVLTASEAGAANSIESPDTGNVGEFTSLALDASGYPVVRYWKQTNHDLKVLHCNDPDCAGNDENIEKQGSEK